MLLRGLVSLLAAVALMAQDRIPVAATNRLQIRTRGPVVVRGSAGDRVTYKLAAPASVGTRVTGDLTRLVVTPGAAARLELNVPRQVVSVTIQTALGGIDADDLEGSLEAVTGGGEIRLGRIGGAVRCVSGGGSIYIDSAGAEANCETAGGDVAVREAKGPLALSTEGGNIRVKRAASTVEAHSAAGLIEVTEAGGQVFADTRGGSIQVGSARGVRGESMAGTIRVRTASGPLHVSTAAGSILAELLAGTRLEESSLAAAAGDITVLIPSHLALSVMARNDSGGAPRIVSDFAEVRARSIGFSRPPLVMEGTINGGGPLLRINASAGTIYLRKLK